MRGKILGILVAKNDDGYELNLDIEEVSWKGKTRKSTMNLFTAQEINANATKHLKEGLVRKTKTQISAEEYNGNVVEINTRIHKDLATLKCECKSTQYRVFKSAEITELYSGIFKSHHKIAISYCCPDCGNEFTAYGNISRWSIKQLLKKIW